MFVHLQVNRGIIDDNDLIVINGSLSSIPVNAGSSVEFSRRYHPRYPGALRSSLINWIEMMNVLFHTPNTCIILYIYFVMCCFTHQIFVLVCSGMQLLECVLFPGLPRRFCVVLVGDTVGYPILNHVGNGDDASPTPCDW